MPIPHTLTAHYRNMPITSVLLYFSNMPITQVLLYIYNCPCIKVKAFVLKLENNNFICQINVKVAVYLLWPGEVECKLSWQSFQYFASASRASDPCCRVKQDNNSYMTSNISILFRFQQSPEVTS